MVKIDSKCRNRNNTSKYYVEERKRAVYNNVESVLDGIFFFLFFSL